LKRRRSGRPRRKTTHYAVVAALNDANEECSGGAKKAAAPASPSQVATSPTPRVSAVARTTTPTADSSHPPDAQATPPVEPPAEPTQVSTSDELLRRLAEEDQGAEQPFKLVRIGRYQALEDRVYEIWLPSNGGEDCK
jgi:hypothetical protein